MESSIVFPVLSGPCVGWVGWGHTVGVLRHQDASGRLAASSWFSSPVTGWWGCGGGGGWLVCLGFQVPCRTVHMGCSVCVGGVGLLFEIWIVDASIFVVCCRQRGRAVPVLRLLPLVWGGGGGPVWCGVGGGKL